MFSFDRVHGETTTRIGKLGSFPLGLLAPMYLVMLYKKGYMCYRDNYTIIKQMR